MPESENDDGLPSVPGSPSGGEGSEPELPPVSEGGTKLKDRRQKLYQEVESIFDSKGAAVYLKWQIWGQPVRRVSGKGLRHRPCPGGQVGGLGKRGAHSRAGRCAETSEEHACPEQLRRLVSEFIPATGRAAGCAGLWRHGGNARSGDAESTRLPNSKEDQDHDEQHEACWGPTHKTVHEGSCPPTDQRRRAWSQLGQMVSGLPGPAL